MAVAPSSGPTVHYARILSDCVNAYHSCFRSEHMDQDQRYRRVNVGDDEIVIYDVADGKAWIQSDYFVELHRAQDNPQHR